MRDEISEEADEETVVRRRVPVDDDATVVRRRASGRPTAAGSADADADADAVTVVRSVPAVSAAPVADAVPPTGSAAPADSVDTPSPRQLFKPVVRAPVMPPLPAPPVTRGPDAEEAVAQRRPAPRAVPRVYGARAATAQAPVHIDSVQQRIGPPPSGRALPAVPRPELPSLAKRARRRGVVTLASYAGAIVVSGIGLVLVARLAFG